MEAALREQRFQTALSHFSGFFEELDRHFVERSELLRQIALALLAREHVLMCGPPGTAKSQVASAVLRRILDEKTGEPSLFARQFTENTVQTDLVGPIDFKTLTETGRTEHFTDEGMLGSVHAFLDEVLDGRDMLLRSTLNVLHERELKQGGKITKGHIECALMTTNRYLSEVLEQSRETLLAFVDRIAFVCFVPKGFSGTSSLEQVLHGQVAGQRPPPLRAPLTIQDLDVLQDAVERVHVPPSLCNALATFVRAFEHEVGKAVRADPKFMPTRYLSTRTVVRLGKLLRAICVYDLAFGNGERPLVARQSDLGMLELALVLAGPAVDDIDQLLEGETDPRERKQLSILRTEKQLFRQCLSRLPPPPEDEPVDEAEDVLTDPEPLDAQLPAKLVSRAQTLAAVADKGGGWAQDARTALAEVVDELARRAFASGLAVGLDGQATPFDVAQGLASLADELEAASGERRPTARWLRGRALEVLHRAVRLAPTALGATLSAESKSAATTSVAKERIKGILGRLQAASRLRDELRAGAALEETPDAGDLAWRRAVEAATEDVARVWDSAFLASVVEALGNGPTPELGALMASLREPLLAMAETDSWFTRLDEGAPSVRDRVVRERLGPVVRAAFARFDATDRLKVTDQVEATLQTLESAGLGAAIAPSDILEWTAEALLRTENLVEEATFEASYQGYRKHRLLEQRVSCAFVLADLGRRLLPRGTEATGGPHVGLDAIKQAFDALPPDTRKRCIVRDIERIEEPVALLQSWWTAVRERADRLPPDEALSHLVRAKFFRVTMDEQALVRYELELELLRRIAGAPAAQIDELERRVRDLAQKSTRFAHDLLGRRAGEEWAAALEQSES